MSMELKDFERHIFQLTKKHQIHYKGRTIINTGISNSWEVLYEACENCYKKEIIEF